MINIFPKSVYLFHLKDSDNKSLENLKIELLGSKKFNIHSLSGESRIEYFGELDYDQIVLTRAIGISSRLALYPSAFIKILDNENSIKLTIKLSVYWKMIVLFIYIIIIFYLLLCSLTLEINKLPIILVKSSIIVFIQNALIFGYHYYEKKNLFSIIQNLVTSK